MPHRAPARPAARFVTTPASSYSVNISATCSALNDLAYACSSTIIRIAPSVTVKSRYEIEMTANGRSAFLGGSVDDDGLDGLCLDDVDGAHGSEQRSRQRVGRVHAHPSFGAKSAGFCRSI